MDWGSLRGTGRSSRKSAQGCCSKAAQRVISGAISETARWRASRSAAATSRCRVDDQDLSRVALFNGGGRASGNATPEVRRSLKQQARSTRVGMWGGRDEDDDQVL